MDKSDKNGLIICIFLVLILTLVFSYVWFWEFNPEKHECLERKLLYRMSNYIVEGRYEECISGGNYLIQDDMLFCNECIKWKSRAN